MADPNLQSGIIRPLEAVEPDPAAPGTLLAGENAVMGAVEPLPILIWESTVICGADDGEESLLADDAGALFALGEPNGALIWEGAAVAGADDGEECVLGAGDGFVFGFLDVAPVLAWGGVVGG